MGIYDMKDWMFKCIVISYICHCNSNEKIPTWILQNLQKPLRRNEIATDYFSPLCWQHSLKHLDIKIRIRYFWQEKQISNFIFNKKNNCLETPNVKSNVNSRYFFKSASYYRFLFAWKYVNKLQSLSGSLKS